MRLLRLLALGSLVCSSAAYAAKRLPLDVGKAKVRLGDLLHRELENHVPYSSNYRSHTSVKSVRSKRLSDNRYLLSVRGGNDQTGYLSGVSAKAIVSLAPGKRGLPLQTIRKIEVVSAPFKR